MKTKKRCIRWAPGDIVDTVFLQSADVSTVIGKKGKQVKKIAEVAQVAIVSPDINKEPIFIVSGNKTNVEAAIFWIKLTAFCVNETNYFSQETVLLIRQLLENYSQGITSEFLKNTEKIINLRKLMEKYPLLASDETYLEAPIPSNDSYYCWNCKQTKSRVAKALCGHKLCCDVCIVHLFKDFYLKCQVCKIKIDNFLVETCRA